MSIFVADKAWQGRGVASEAMLAILDDCFTRLKLERITSDVFSNNPSSLRLQQKLGFVHEGTSRSSAVGMNGERLDVVRFGMLREDWHAFQRRRAEAASHPCPPAASHAQDGVADWAT
jgi:RimJ/RimL family protein N-acetyltransferase